MLTMTITQDAIGRDYAEIVAKGERYHAISRTGVTMRLARDLREAGIPDQEFEVRGADGRLRFTTNRTLHEWANLTMTEGDASKPRITKYVDVSAVFRATGE